MRFLPLHTLNNQSFRATHAHLSGRALWAKWPWAHLLHRRFYLDFSVGASKSYCVGVALLGTDVSYSSFSRAEALSRCVRRAQSAKEVVARPCDLVDLLVADSFLDIGWGWRAARTARKSVAISGEELTPARTRIADAGHAGHTLLRSLAILSAASRLCSVRHFVYDLNGGA